MFDEVFGLPMHPLMVHATVVMLPAAAITVGLAAAWPRFRRRAGVVPLVLSVLALVLVPITVQSGKSLVERVDETALVATHQERGEGLLPFAIALAVTAAALYWMHHRQTRSRDGDGDDTPRVYRVLRAAVAGLALVSAVAVTVQVIRVGHSGSEAAWSDTELIDG